MIITNNDISNVKLRNKVSHSETITICSITPTDIIFRYEVSDVRQRFIL